MNNCHVLSITKAYITFDSDLIDPVYEFVEPLRPLCRNFVPVNALVSDYKYCCI